MRKIFAMIPTFIAKTMAVFFAALFIAIAPLIFLILNVDHTLLNSSTYTGALIENNFYERFPALVAEEFSMVKTFLADPCKASPLMCAIEGAAPELQACLMGTLGEEAYMEIGTGKRNATQPELDASQACLDQFGIPASTSGPDNGSPDENPLAVASAEVQNCAHQSLGDDVYNALKDAQRMPDETESRKVIACYEQAGETPPSSITGGNMPFLDNLTIEQWQELFLILLPPDILQYMTESALDETFAYLNGERDTASLPMDKFKANLISGGGDDLILLILSAQPTCTEEQIAQLQSASFGEEGSPPIFCAAQGKTLAILSTELRRQLNEAISSVPNKATFIKPPSTSDSSNENGPFSGKNPQEVLKKINLVIHLSPLLPLVLLLLVAVFGVRSVKGWLRWWGIPILIVGLITLIIGIALRPLLDWAWINYIVAKIPPLVSASLGELGHSLAVSLIRDFATWIMIEAALIFALGLGGIIGSYFVKPKLMQSVSAEILESPASEG